MPCVKTASIDINKKTEEGEWNGGLTIVCEGFPKLVCKSTCRT